MLDDIDYSGLTATSANAVPTSEPKKKSNIAERSVVKQQDKPARKPVDVEKISQKAKDIEADVGAPEIPDPLAQYGLPALGALGALGTAYGVYQALQNRAKAPNTPVPPTVPSGPDYSAYESPAYLRNAPVAPPAAVEAAPAPQAPAPDRLQQAQQLAEANRQLGLGNKPTIPAMPLEPVSTPITAAPVDAPAPTPTAGPGSFTTTAVVDEIKDMIQKTPDPTTGVTELPVSQAAPQVSPKPVPPVYPKAGAKFKTEADLPPGFVARYDIGNIDRSMGNILGLENRAHARDLLNQGKPFGQAGPGKNQLNTDVSNLTRQYFEQLQGQIPETLLGREARQAQKIPSEFGVFAKNTNFGRGVTIGGRAATIFALSDIANAQTPAERGMAGANLLEAVIPPGFTMSGAGQGSSAVPSVDQALLLGSPYAQTEFAKKRRQQEEYTRKVGAGRGIAPPSAYLR
jgi:hypothetical protein